MELVAVIRITSNHDCLSGENMAEGKAEGQVAIVEFREEADGEVPYLLLVKAAIIEEKQ
jgi:hypothetical protein